MYYHEDEIVISLCIIIIASVLQRIQRKKRQRKKWVRAWIKRRRKHGAHHALVKELSDEDPQCFRNFLKMDTRDFFLNNAKTECSTNVLLLDIVHITAESAFCSSIIPLL
jgi:hypothetical protein